MKSHQNKIEIVLRIAVFGTFLGHGVFAIMQNGSWIPFLTFWGFSQKTALTLMPIIGAIDILVAIITLYKPHRYLLIYAVIWAFATALMRPMIGTPIWSFVERSANWGAPLALLWFSNYKSLLSIFSRK